MDFSVPGEGAAASDFFSHSNVQLRTMAVKGGVRYGIKIQGLQGPLRAPHPQFCADGLICNRNNIPPIVRRGFDGRTRMIGRLISTNSHAAQASSQSCPVGLEKQEQLVSMC